MEVSPLDAMAERFEGEDFKLTNVQMRKLIKIILVVGSAPNKPTANMVSFGDTMMMTLLILRISNFLSSHVSTVLNIV